jgi:hypothetical protein
MSLITCFADHHVFFDGSQQNESRVNDTEDVYRETCEKGRVLNANGNSYTMNGIDIERLYVFILMESAGKKKEKKNVFFNNEHE